jgi:hypothetical protein
MSIDEVSKPVDIQRVLTRVGWSSRIANCWHVSYRPFDGLSRRKERRRFAALNRIGSTPRSLNRHESPTGA